MLRDPRVWQLLRIGCIVLIGAIGLGFGYALYTAHKIENEKIALHPEDGNHVVDERSFRQQEFDRVVAAIRNGTLVPDAHGVVSLPVTQADLTEDGKVYVSRPFVGTLQVLFVSTRKTVSTGIQQATIFPGYAYSDAPHGTKLKLIAPVSRIQTGDVVFNIVKEIAPHWYYVTPFTQ